MDDILFLFFDFFFLREEMSGETSDVVREERVIMRDDERVIIHERERERAVYILLFLFHM